MRHILTADNGRVFKRLVDNGINPDTNQMDFDLIRPAPKQIANALQDAILANDAIGLYLLNLAFSGEDVPSTVMAVVANLKENGEEFLNGIGKERQRFLTTFNDASSLFDLKIDDKLEEAYIAQMKRQLKADEAHIVENNVDLNVFAKEPTERLAQSIKDNFSGLDLHLLSWLVRKGQNLVENYLAFQSFNLTDWLPENWKITENAFGTAIDKKNSQIVFNTHHIVGLTDLMETLKKKSDVQMDDAHYTYEL